MCAALLISVLPALKLIEQRAVMRVVRFKSAGGFRMVERNCVVSYLIIGYCAVVVPVPAAFFHLFKHIQTFAIIAVLNIVQSRTQILFILGFCLRTRIGAAVLTGIAVALRALALTCPALAAETPEVSEATKTESSEAKAAERACLTVETPALTALTAPALRTLRTVAITLLRLIFALSLIHDHAVCLLNLFELFLKLFLVRLSDIRIRMVSAAQRPVCFFNFILGGIIGDTQHFVWIHEFLFLAFLFNLLSFGFAVAHPNTGV